MTTNRPAPANGPTQRRYSQHRHRELRFQTPSPNSNCKPKPQTPISQTPTLSFVRHPNYPDALGCPAIINSTLHIKRPNRRLMSNKKQTRLHPVLINRVATAMHYTQVIDTRQLRPLSSQELPRLHQHHHSPFPLIRAPSPASAPLPPRCSTAGCGPTRKSLPQPPA
jgi:hypothetical protein